MKLVQLRRTQVMHLYFSPSPPSLPRSLTEIKELKDERLFPIHSFPQYDPHDWNVTLFQTSQVRKPKGCSITLIISLLNTWADDNSERIYKNVCPQSAAKPYLWITSIQ